MDPREAIIWYAVFVFSATLHEAAHAYFAKKGGDLTAYLGGQVSLDPLPHMRREPVGMVILPLVSLYFMGWPIGFASAPYNLQWAYDNHRKAAKMALAGPMSNLCMVVLSVILMKIGLSMGYFVPPEAKRLAQLVTGAETGVAVNISILLSTFCSLNLVLTILNLIPLPPLDGSEIISFFLTKAQARKYKDFMHRPGLSLMGMFIAWNVFPALFGPAINVVLQLIYS
ncbi:MAG: site-2 protease family protein [Planctomycetes bacterium]|nr:site-2 protease family protein [Planctomycetota bacterium]